MFMTSSAYISIHMHYVCLPNWNYLHDNVLHERHGDLSGICLLNYKPKIAVKLYMPIAAFVALFFAETYLNIERVY